MQTPPTTPTIFAPTPPPNSPIQWMLVSPVPQVPFVINWNDIEAASESIFNQQVRSSTPQPRRMSIEGMDKSLFEFRKCIMEVLIRRKFRFFKKYIK